MKTRAIRLLFALAVISFGFTINAVPSSASVDSTGFKAGSSAASEIREYYKGQVLTWNKYTWNGANTCVVYGPTEVHCYDSRQEATAVQLAEARRLAGPNSAEGYDCTAYSYIVDGTGYSGHGLGFADWGYWQNLDQWVATPWTVRSWDNIHDSCKGYIRGFDPCHYIAPYTGQTSIYVRTSQIFLQKPSNPPAPGC